MKKRTNPFYILLVVAGVAFAITALAFGVMAVRGLQNSRAVGYGPVEPKPSLIAKSSSFDDIVDRYGTQAMIWELVLLTIGTVGAIGYDQHLDRRDAELSSIVPAMDHPEKGPRESSS